MERRMTSGRDVAFVNNASLLLCCSRVRNNSTSLEPCITEEETYRQRNKNRKKSKCNWILNKRHCFCATRNFDPKIAVGFQSGRNIALQMLRLIRRK
ncbi:hypothetical protein CEXT_747711 [Caerostris extrusa]|uniref:Uncharacterized protein n=1 Tax=Caerostris extrusa TaxID=172846 RepID=A0AAV4T3H7_CAEEX|nr:hypothetical protein CEXT_747711 [Caerostris extrusa]